MPLNLFVRSKTAEQSFPKIKQTNAMADATDDIKLGDLHIGTEPHPAGATSIRKTMNVTYISNIITYNTVGMTPPRNAFPGAAGGVTGAAEDDQKEEFFTPKPPASIASAVPDNGSGITLVVIGIVGTDEKQHVMIPQKLTFVFDKANAKQEAMVRKEIAESVEKWNAIPGCSCDTFTFEMNNWVGDPVTVISGLTHGYSSKVFPDKKGRAAREAE